ncbi:hypothetical protein [Aeoliella mucimassa]|uniref:Uncharacterized protein n=1 Tax=Aeoliella mucimassa TaxID=2527972 RepID=A0A518AMA8_9BACT|nr:hypothetical protein [Aeoliella mucimassa]QDU55859.1 hypothetical protein Pan181_20560 [Aeoliella mucimassa]
MDYQQILTDVLGYSLSSFEIFLLVIITGLWTALYVGTIRLKLAGCRTSEEEQEHFAGWPPQSPGCVAVGTACGLFVGCVLGSTLVAIEAIMERFGCGQWEAFRRLFSAMIESFGSVIQLW